MTRTTWSAVRSGAIGVALAVMAAACSSGTGPAMSPSSVSPSSLDVGGGVVREFTVAIQETSVPVGPATLHVTLTRSTTSDSSQQLGSARIVVPAGLTVTGVGDPSAGAKNWTGSWSGQTVTIGADGGTDKLQAGESVSFTIDVTSTVCDLYTFSGTLLNPNPAASNETYGGTFSSQWVYIGSTLSVSVTGCTTCSAPEAPSISHAYFTDSIANGGLGLAANDPRHSAVQVAVAHEQAADKTFHGLSPCDAGFAAEVKAFVDSFLANYVP